MKLYLSGKITGDKNYKEKFGNVEDILLKMGFAVFNPAILPDGFSYEEYMSMDFLALSFCDGILLLNDWEDSPGAIREKKEAERLGLKVYHEEDFIEAYLGRERFINLFMNTGIGLMSISSF